MHELKVPSTAAQNFGTGIKLLVCGILLLSCIKTFRVKIIDVNYLVNQLNAVLKVWFTNIRQFLWSCLYACDNLKYCKFVLRPL